ncbi:site-specific integrase [Fangia hongkongensis]|uniref:site-specific integrase n=1 Tax=Fangia hongkongensis TaxID=270495 RepID=UPI00039C3C12|nr:site-specific integrase [Fangia hongkongensis]MBK2126106.1 site-specific integrase [Fangia hongkongensis]
MPKLKFTKTFIDGLEPPEKRIDYTDSDCKGLMLRVNTSGDKYYAIRYRNNQGKYVRYTIGRHGSITLVQARNEAIRLFGLLSQGVDIQREKNNAKHGNSDICTFGEYLNEFYFNWFKQNRKGDQSTINMLKNTLKNFHKMRLDHINNKKLNMFVGNYQSERGVTNKRINRIITAFKASLNIAVENGFTEYNGIKGVRLLHEDRHNIVRYLSAEEEQRLLDAVNDIYFQYKNIITLALNTGMRSGEILSLEFKDINLNKEYVALRSENTKAQKMRYVPLNQKSIDALQSQIDNKLSKYVFTNPRTKEPYTKNRDWFKKLLEQADIDNFRFHDLRHTFASKLIMRGVDLNTVRELMGHSDIKMTLIYAHLAPEHKKKAVDLL